MDKKVEYKRINLRIGAGVKEDLEKMAREYGCSLNSLIAYIVGSYVSTHKRVVGDIPERFQEAIVEVFKAGMESGKEPDA